MRNRQYLGRILRIELFFPFLILFGGVGSITNGDIGAGAIAIVGTVCLIIALMVFPGPLRANAISVGIALLAAAFTAFAWLPFWELWVDGFAVPLLTGFTAGMGSQFLGRWNDRILGPRIVASEVQERIAIGYPINIPGLFLHVHYGRWFGMAESTLPIPLHLKGGSSKMLLPGDRHFWLASRPDRAPDMAEMMAPREIYTFPEHSG